MAYPEIFPKQHQIVCVRIVPKASTGSLTVTAQQQQQRIIIFRVCAISPPFLRLLAQRGAYSRVLPHEEACKISGARETRAYPAEMQNRRGEGGAGKERILWFFSKWTVDEGSVRKGYRDETPGQGWCMVWCLLKGGGREILAAPSPDIDLCGLPQGLFLVDDH
ncbi:uncharacterized protein H6S33_000671 [Morchella sextelata]|uniref:uncharacterized protein n=1 Tax=Morchella sextelata TaxID=1174677 RepID=UPI001D0594F2|nr:uncharacterized protein H6S33_000671 [Morchella sextelata]KAH0615035.1 hypothetical protein H6S33_000671 [Morchella sextelata]